MTERDGRLQSLSKQLAAILTAIEGSHPRTFNAGLVDARLAAEEIACAFNRGPSDLNPGIMVALTRIATTLTPTQHEPDFALAESTFQKLRGILIHGWRPSLAAEATLTVKGEVRHTKPIRPSRRTRYATDLALRLLSPVHRQRYRRGNWIGP